MSEPINIQQAVKLAVAHMQSLEGLLPLDGLRLEETTVSRQGNWLITLSTRDSSFPLVEKRNYKTLEVDVKSKKVVSMKLRNPFAEAS